MMNLFALIVYNLLCVLYVYVNFLYGRLGQDSREEEISFNLNGTFLEK